MVGVGSAARIARGQPGHAVLRLGSDEHLLIQTACVTGSGRVAPEMVVVRRLDEAREPAASGGPSDLEAIVAAAGRARRWHARPRLTGPGSTPSPTSSPLGALPAGAVALADRPDDQEQSPIAVGARRGHLLLYGGAGAGTTTALAAIALDIARSESPDAVHVLVADLGTGRLAGLAGLPHVGAVVPAGERGARRPVGTRPQVRA